MSTKWRMNLISSRSTFYSFILSKILFLCPPLMLLPSYRLVSSTFWFTNCLRKVVLFDYWPSFLRVGWLIAAVDVWVVLQSGFMESVGNKGIEREEPCIEGLAFRMYWGSCQRGGEEVYLKFTRCDCLVSGLWLIW